MRLLHKASEPGVFYWPHCWRGGGMLEEGGRRGARGRSNGRRQGPRGGRSCSSEAGAPEFEQVVGGGDQLPLGLAGGEAAAEKAVGAANAFRVREDRFDDLL